MRALERIAVFAETLESGGEAGTGALAVAGIPVQRADFPVKTSDRRAIAARVALVTQRFVLGQRVVAVSREGLKVGEALPHGPRLLATRGALGEGCERALVVTERVVVGVDRTGPIARRL